MKNEKFRDLIFYEIYPVSFFDSNGDGIGDLKGIELKLEYIKNLGFNAIWLNPFYKSPFMDGGYDVTDFYDIDERFGTMEDFDSLLRKAKELGLFFVIDLVAGHVSEQHKDFLRSAEYLENEMSDLFIWSHDEIKSDKEYTLISGRHDRDAQYMVNFFSIQPAINYGFNKITNPKWQMSYKDERTFKAREYLLNIMRFWFDKGVDGFRVDLANSLVKNDPNKEATIELWNYLFDIIRKEYPNKFFVSEWGDISSSDAGFDSDFMLDSPNTFLSELVRNTSDANGLNILSGGSTLSIFVEDMKKRYSSNSFVSVISGNHDETRLTSSIDKKAIRLFYLYLFMMPGIPFLYYGDEIGMEHTSKLSKDGGYQRTGSRTPMQWDNSLNFGFTKSNNPYLPLGKANSNNVLDMEKDENSLLNYIKKLISFRKSSKDIKSDDFDVYEEENVVFIKRGIYTLIMNLSDEPYLYKNEPVLKSNDIDGILYKYDGVLIKNE